MVIRSLKSGTIICLLLIIMGATPALAGNVLIKNSSKQIYLIVSYKRNFLINLKDLPEFYDVCVPPGQTKDFGSFFHIIEKIFVYTKKHSCTSTVDNPSRTTHTPTGDLTLRRSFTVTVDSNGAVKING